MIRFRRGGSAYTEWIGHLGKTIGPFSSTGKYCIETIEPVVQARWAAGTPSDVSGTTEEASGT